MDLTDFSSETKRENKHTRVIKMLIIIFENGEILIKANTIITFAQN